MHRALLIIPVLMALLTPSAAAASKVEDTFFNSIIPSRVDSMIGYIPTTFVIHPQGEPVKPITVRVGGKTYRFVFGNAAAAVGPTIDIYLRNARKSLRYPTPLGMFADRKLTATERKSFKTRADLGRDADVLAVALNHPACTSGVSRAAARAIANGRIRTWSEAGVPTPASGDAIALRRAGGETAEPRFGASYKTPTGARRARDGGLSEAASGNTSVAAITSWARARAYSQTTCAVPVGGMAPTDENVRALTHADAYPIHFIVPRWKRQDRHVNAITTAFVKYLTGDRARGLFAQRGMLLASGDWPTVASPVVGELVPVPDENEPAPQDPPPAETQ